VVCLDCFDGEGMILTWSWAFEKKAEEIAMITRNNFPGDIGSQLGVFEHYKIRLKSAVRVKGIPFFSGPPRNRQ
jgi:hypothetical protein